LAFEPLALGLLVAPSVGGSALALATVAGFFSRRPLKAAFAKASWPSPDASRAAVLLVVCIGAGLIETAILGGVAALWPLLSAAPFGGLFLYFDAQGDSRAAAAELAGCVAFALLPAAFATLAGWSVTAAFALTAIAVTRSIPTVLTIRTCLRIRKGKNASRSIPVLASVLGFGAVIFLAAIRQVPWLAVSAAALLSIRTAWMMTSPGLKWTVKRVGIAEALLGMVYVALITFAYHAQWCQ
jgi:hypothetical protein